MWRKAGVVRDEAKLREALEEIAGLRRRLPRLGASSGRMMLEALALPMALNAAEIICGAALERTESRGAHYRADYPERDEGWLRTVVVRRGPSGEMRITPEPL